MAHTVDDLLETLHGPVSDQLRQREGKRLKGLDLSKKAEGNPTIPDETTTKGEPGTEGGRELRPDDLDPYEKSEREHAGHVELPEEE